MTKLYFEVKVLIAFMVLMILGYGCRQSNKVNTDYTNDEKVWIENHDKITLSVDDTYPPLNFVNKYGEMEGLNIDIIRLIEKHIGIPIELVGSDWNNALNKAMNHEVDGIINASPLIERKSKLNFTEEILKDPWAFISHKDFEPISGFDDLENKTVAAKKNGRQLQALKDKAPKAQIVEVNTLIEGIKLLSQKKVDGVFDDLAPLYHIITASNFNNIEIAFIELSDEGSQIGLRNNDTTLLSIFNKAILSISEDKKNAIQNKWLKVTPVRDLTIHYLIIGLLFLLIILGSLWAFSLRVIVQKRTSELKMELAQRKKTEKELIWVKEKAVESDKLKSAFLANMSHEIRTPLNAIVGFSNLLIEGNLPTEEKLLYGNIIKTSSDSLLNLINDIIDISKIEAGHLEIHFSSFSIGSVFNELDTIFKLESERINKQTEQKLDFKTKIPDALENIVICTDKNRFTQITTILINNAIKFTGNGFVETGCFLNKNEQIVFYVKDTGIGINPENQKVIFNRFRKIEDDKTNLYRGAGLGLSIAQQLAKLLHGEIWVESEENKGSTFFFTISSK